MITLLLASIAFLLSLILGFIIVSLLWPDTLPAYSVFPLKCFLSVGIGFGITSCTFFCWLIIFVSPKECNFMSYAVFEIILGICMFLFLNRRSNRSIPLLRDSSSLNHRQKSSYILIAVSVFVLVSAMISFLYVSLRNPHGGWDAWAIWNLKARFIARGTEYYTNIFSETISFSHPDYPLLLPLSIARYWKYIGNETVMVPIIVAMLFVFSTAGLIFSSLSVLRSKTQGILALVVLLSASPFVANGAFQYADVPLSFFILSVIVLIAMHDFIEPKKYQLLSLAGMTAGLIAWTKNEGLLFFVVIVFMRFIVLIPFMGWKRCLRESLFFIAGAIPVLVTIIYFKIKLAPPTDIFIPSNKMAGAILVYQSLTEKLSDYSRYILIFNSMAKAIWQFSSISIGIIPLLLIYLFVCKSNKTKQNKFSIVTFFGTLVLMMAGYFFIYLISPYDLSWHLGTSLDRLILQLWPSFVFLLFFVVRTSEEISIGIKQ
jgi:hypothetical protein